MLQRKHIQVFRPQPSHSVPFVPLFLLLFSSFSTFFSFLFSFFFFWSNRSKKKKIIFFFLSCSYFGPSQDGLENSCRHAEDNMEYLLFNFIFQKGFFFFFFLFNYFFSFNFVELKNTFFSLTNCSNTIFFLGVTLPWIFGSFWSSGFENGKFDDSILLVVCCIAGF